MVGKRILLLSGGSPWPVSSGGYQRTNLLFQALAAQGTVDTLIVSRHVRLTHEMVQHLREVYRLVGIAKPQPVYERAPWSMVGRVIPTARAEWLIHAFRGWIEDFQPDPAVGAKVRAQLARHSYDLVVSRYLRPLMMAEPLPDIPKIVDVDDFESEVLELRLKLPEMSWWRRWSLRRRLGAVRRIESRLGSRCGHCWVTKESDLHRVGQMSAGVLPNIPYPFGGKAFPPPRREAVKSRKMVFVGSMTHLENIWGLDGFLRYCWPAIVQAVPDALFGVYGSGVSEEQRARWSAHQGVEVVGYVSNIAEAYEDAAFAVVPLFGGGGTKVKVLEAFMYGRTCVAAQPSVHGYEGILRHRESLWVGSTYQELTLGCIHLFTHPVTRRRMSAEGHHRVARHYTFARFARVVAGDVGRVLSDWG